MENLLPFFPIADENMSWDLYQDENFHLDTLASIDGLRGYQKFIQLFMSPYTPYRTLLLKHSMGSGKTRTALAVILHHFYYSASTKCLILSPNQSHISNISGLIRETAKELYANDPKLSDILSYLSSERNVAYFTFSKVKEKDFERANLVIIDEVHALHLKKKTETTAATTRKKRGIEKRDLYREFQENITKYILPNKRKRLLLMTGTPITDSFTKIFEIMDLMLEPHLRFNNTPVDFFDTNNTLTPVAKKLIADRFRGRVSSVQMVFAQIPEKVMGGYYNYAKNTTVNKVNHPTTSRTKVVLDLMPREGYQAKMFLRSWRKELGRLEEDALFVFPDKLVYSDVITESDVSVFLKPEFKDLRQKLGDPTFLYNHGILYHSVLEAMGTWDPDDSPRRKEAVFFFNTTVKSTGNKLFSLILSANKYIRLDDMDLVRQEVVSNRLSNESHAYRRFIVASSKFGVSRDFNEAVQIFSHKNNREGKFLRLIIGSEIASHGYNLVNGRQVHTVIQWADTVVRQATARVLRGKTYFSGEDATVKIYNHMVGVEGVVDKKLPFCRRLISSETKQVQNAQILHLLDKYAVDCFTNQKFHSQKHYDDKVECNFKKCAENYKCAGTTTKSSASDRMFVFETDAAEERCRKLLQQTFNSTMEISLTQFIQRCAGQLTESEVYRYVLRLILSRRHFDDKRGLVGPLGCYFDVLYVDVTDVQDVDAIEVIAQPLTLHLPAHPIDADRTYVLEREMPAIKSFVQSPNSDAYNELSVFARAWVFEECHKSSSGGHANLCRLVEKEEADNFDKTTFAHKLYPVNQIKSHTLENVEITEGYRIRDDAGVWHFGDDMEEVKSTTKKVAAAAATTVKEVAPKKEPKKKKQPTTVTSSRVATDVNADKLLVLRREGGTVVYKMVKSLAVVDSKGNAKPSRDDVLKLTHSYIRVAEDKGLDLSRILKEFKMTKDTIIEFLGRRSTAYLPWLVNLYKIQSKVYGQEY